MKKIFALLLLVTAFHAGIFAQTKIGGRVGMNLTTITLGDDPVKEYRTLLPGVNGGFVMEFGEDVVFSPGIIVSMQGLKAKDGDYKEMFRTTYLTIPLQATINIARGSNKSVSGYFTLGTFVAFWLKAKLIQAYQGDKLTENYEIDKLVDNRYDIGVSVGAGVNVHLGKRTLRIGPSFAMGLLDMAKYPYGKPQNQKSYLNMVFSTVNFAYLIAVGNKDQPKSPTHRL